MNSSVLEPLAELLPVLVYGVIASVLTAVGAIAEYNSLQYVGSGELVLALWFAGIGGIMLYAGVYGLGYQKVVRKVVQ